jgi:hypothetical protein
MRLILNGTLLGAMVLVAPAAAQRGIPGNGTSLVEGWYHKFLNREPGPHAGRWVAAIQQGQSPESVLAQFLATPEYYAKGGGTREGFIDTIYRDVIGRPPIQGEMDFWYPRLGYTTRGDMAYALVTYTGPTTPPPGYYDQQDPGYNPGPDYHYRRPGYPFGQ